MGLTELAKEYFELYEKKAELEDQKKQVQKNLDAKMYELVQEMDNVGVSSFKDSELSRTFYQEQDCYLKTTDNDAFFQWVRDQGAGELIKETIHASSKKAMVKDYIHETGGEVPGIEADFFTKIKMRKA